MSLSLPLSDNPIRALFDVAHLAELADFANRSKLRGFRETILSARRIMTDDKTVRAVHSVCLRADGELWLIRVGPKGGCKKVWNFGKL
jgi:hypothetical protein